MGDPVAADENGSAPSCFMSRRITILKLKKGQRSAHSACKEMLNLATKYQKTKLHALDRRPHQLDPRVHIFERASALSTQLGGSPMLDLPVLILLILVLLAQHSRL